MLLINLICILGLRLQLYFDSLTLVIYLSRVWHCCPFPVNPCRVDRPTICKLHGKDNWTVYSIPLFINRHGWILFLALCVVCPRILIYPRVIVSPGLYAFLFTATDVEHRVDILADNDRDPFAHARASQRRAHPLDALHHGWRRRACLFLI